MSAATAARITVHLLALDLTAAALDDGSGLAPGDLHRAATIGCRSQRAGFLAGRRAIRRLLAERLRCAPADVAITATPRGKLEVGERGPAFSVARRDRWCAIALSEDCPVGVDVESIRPLDGLDALIAQFLPEEARSSLAGLGATERLPDFFRWWTRLEAATKACGRGLDEGAACLALAPQRGCDAVPGLALAVAARTTLPFEIEWHLPAAEGGTRD